MHQIISFIVPKIICLHAQNVQVMLYMENATFYLIVLVFLAIENLFLTIRTFLLRISRKKLEKGQNCLIKSHNYLFYSVSETSFHTFTSRCVKP